MARKLRVMGIDFADTTFRAAIDELGTIIRGPVSYSLFFINAATLNIAHAQAAYRAVLNKGSLVFADGTGVRWAAKARGKNLRANLNGTDVIPALIKANRGIRVFLLGGDRNTIERAARKFPALFPQAELVGWHHGYFDHADSSQIVAAINDAEPHLLLVGFGNPLQEQWIAANLPGLNVPLTAGVGGLFAYWAGILDRAPGIYRRLGAEWLHILGRQPYKWRRYVLGNPLLILRMLTWIPADLDRNAAYRPG